MTLSFFAGTHGAIDYATSEETKMGDEIYPPLFAKG
jgi:hypothetical protein